MSRFAAIAATIFGAIALLAAAPAPAATPQQVMPCAAADGSAHPIRYPVQAQKAGRQGSVALSVVVDASGGASKVAVSRSSGSADLDRAARASARHARFCQLDGNTPALAGAAQMRVDFRMDQLPLVAGR